MKLFSFKAEENAERTVDTARDMHTADSVPSLAGHVVPEPHQDWLLSTESGVNSKCTLQKNQIQNKTKKGGWGAAAI